MKPKTYEGFWMGRSWVSRCKKCGHVCFDVQQEHDHQDDDCRKSKLLPIPEEDREFNRKPPTRS